MCNVDNAMDDLVPVGTSKTALVGEDGEGWTADAVKALCEIHMPLLPSYNAGNIHYKRQVHEK